MILNLEKKWQEQATETVAQSPVHLPHCLTTSFVAGASVQGCTGGSVSPARTLTLCTAAHSCSQQAYHRGPSDGAHGWRSVAVPMGPTVLSAGFLTAKGLFPLWI